MGSSLDSMQKNKSRPRRNFKNHYHLGRKLGCGAFASVHKCYLKSDPSKAYAIKQIDKRYLSLKELTALQTEIRVLKETNHENVIQLIDLFDNGESVQMVLELCDGKDLFDKIVHAEGSRLTEKQAAKIICDLCIALDYLHFQGIIHRDLKPENILFTKDNTLKISDFGLSCRLPLSSASDDNDSQISLTELEGTKLQTCCGTPHYVAPEVLTNKGYTYKCDLWSIGVILYIMLAGYQPFSAHHRSVKDVYDAILKGDYNFKNKKWFHISNEAKHLITCLLCVDANERYTTKQILQHPWIKKFV